MPELMCLSSTSKNQLFFSLLASDFFLFSSFIISHPLYFSYFIFFSPYLLQLLSFLSPLFITTTLLLLALLSVSPTLFGPNFSSEESSHSHIKLSLLVTAYRAVVERLRSKIDDHNEEILCLEDFEVFKIVFDTSMIENDAKGSQVQGLEDIIINDNDSPVHPCSGHHDFSLSPDEEFVKIENSGDCSLPEQQDKWAEMEEKKMKCFLQELDAFESGITTSVEGEENIDAQPGAKANKAVEKQDEKSMVRDGSKAAAVANKIINQNIVGKGRQKSERVKAHSQKVTANVDYSNESEDYYDMKVESSKTLDYDRGSYGSMRKEKDWKRTLACKLFEERHNADGDEGMDLLWETYEMESANRTKSKGYTKKKKKKHEIKFHGDVEEEEGDCDDESDGKLCCLQALKFSAGKMNLGMGRPSLVRLSKAIKGFGWLHQMSSRHSKKVHIGDRF